MEALNEQKFRAQIGEIIEEDLKNLDSEHGGLVLFDRDANLTLMNIPSKINYDNDMYRIPRESFKIPHVITYHLHAASQDETKSSGPSTTDMFSSLEMCIDFEEAHDIVITKLEGRRFNVDFYGFEFTLDKFSKNTIVDVNDFEIMLDLGVYEY